jgi:hypothetical protein
VRMEIGIGDFGVLSMSFPKFALGQVVATPAALAHLSQCNIDPYDLVRRHQTGDYGDIDAGDVHENEQALKLGNRILSVYELEVPNNAKPLDATAKASERLFVITEADRSSTTILIDREY